MGPTITPDPHRRKELFLVEGKSAASTVRQAMDCRTQEVFALQGKLVNASTASPSKVRANPVCAALLDTLGCGFGEDCDPQKLRYSRVLFLTDPDVDGAHARALLATLFARFLRPLVQNNKVCAVIPPLWRWSGPDDALEYAWTEDELAGLRDSSLSTSESNGTWTGSGGITRFRGVAQFSGAECVELLLGPDTRRQVRLTLGEVTAND